MLKINDVAFDFKLKDKSGKFYSLKDIKGDHKIIYFYPKDDTPGCTIEAQAFTIDLNKFNKINAVIIGISGGDENSKRKFCEKYDLKILLLSDPDFNICRKYNVYGEKSFMGNKFLGIKRTTFVLDKNDRVIKIYENVKPEGHSEEVLKFLKNNG